MAKFIKLHDLDGDTCIVNIELISCVVVDKESDCTNIFFDGDPDELAVKEMPDKIWEMLSSHKL